VSDLRSRLSTLRDQSGNSENGSVKHRLERVGAGRRRRSPRRQRASDETLASHLGGSVVRDGVVLIRECLPSNALHGDFSLTDRGFHQALSYCAELSGNDPHACVFMDTETTGLAGGTGTLVFLLGMARFSAAGLEVSQLFLTGFQGEEAMLEEAQAYLRGADTLVTFNGRSFDAPLLAARYRLSGLSDPFVALRHVDLLHVTRRTFRKSWPDCRLQTVERRLLGLARIGDLPGSEAPRAWFEWVRHGRVDDLSAVCTHNRLDLLSLAVLPTALQRSHDHPVAIGADLLACARQRRHAIGRGEGERTAFEYLERHRVHLDAGGLLELARLARRRREWDLAVALWEQLAAAGVAVAIEHLAKYYEHEVRDLERALQITGRLIARAPGDRQHRRRDARLRARLGFARR
jgi:uncharacterized protein YprB with RNaseH-like and TPR domain